MEEKVEELNFSALKDMLKEIQKICTEEYGDYYPIRLEIYDSGRD